MLHFKKTRTSLARVIFHVMLSNFNTFYTKHVTQKLKIWLKIYFYNTYLQYTRLIVYISKTKNETTALTENFFIFYIFVIFVSWTKPLPHGPRSSTAKWLIKWFLKFPHRLKLFPVKGLFQTLNTFYWKCFWLHSP